MAINDHRRRIRPQWTKERKEIDATEVADILKDNVNNFRDNQEQLRYQEQQKTKQEKGLTEYEATEKKKSEIDHDKNFDRKRDIANANRAMVEKQIKKDGIKLSKRGHRKLLVNADKDFGVRKGSDAFGLARIGKDEIKDLSVATLFTTDLKKVPSSRRRRLKNRRKLELNKMEKSKSLRAKSGMFIGRGKKMKMKKVKLFGYSKAEKMQINRLRGIKMNSPTKAKASKRSVTKTRLIHHSRER